MKNEDLATMAKGFAPVILACFQKLTDALPTWSLWMGAIYATLHLYVFVRDRVMRRAS
jgi:hypothetical protein